MFSVASRRVASRRYMDGCPINAQTVHFMLEFVVVICRTILVYVAAAVGNGSSVIAVVSFKGKA